MTISWQHFEKFNDGLQVFTQQVPTGRTYTEVTEIPFETDDTATAAADRNGGTKVDQLITIIIEGLKLPVKILSNVKILLDYPFVKNLPVNFLSLTFIHSIVPGLCYVKNS